MIKKIKKRNGKVVAFRPSKIETAVWGAFKTTGEAGREVVKAFAKKVVVELEKRFNGTIIPEVEQVQDLVEKLLLEKGYDKTHRAFTLYRELHRNLREITSLVDSDELIEKYLGNQDWRVKENANMTYSLQGLNNHVASIISANFWMNKIYTREVRKAHMQGDIHIHDLALLSPYCTGWDLRDILIKGFGGVSGKVNSKPPKHLGTALGQLVNFFYTIQGEVAGAVAVANFDSYLAPFISFDKLNYKEVKQELQEFMFNMNVPTRVGFQCFSEDTEILTAEGWRGCDEVEAGMVIRTFNLKKKIVEDKEVRSVFRRKYKGTMCRLTNRIQDQLISPGHRVVRRRFNTKNFVLEPIEEVERLKSPFITLVGADSRARDAKVSDEQIKLMAWIIGEGSLERQGRHRCCYRVSIYQSEEKNEENYKEIKRLLNHFGTKYSEYTQHGLGLPVKRIRLDAESSRVVHGWFSKESVKFVPDILVNMSQRQSRLFLETYIKADGFEKNKITCSDWELVNSLQMIACNAGYGSTVLVRQPTAIGKKTIYVLRLIRHQETYIEKIEKVKYEGIIWCPNTENETVIARRNGKVFISGNTPFTNVTLDLKPSKTVGEEAVIIGGKPHSGGAKYGDFQKEIDMFNQAFAEVMAQGDAQGRVFTFPIPTYSITKDFDWDNKKLEPVWEMTRKYGVPYFSNFVNSDMDPDDARSMCCRLRLDNRVLRKRGGLFAANPLTGSIGVVTINLPRIGYLARGDRKKFFAMLGGMMDIARDSLMIKRAEVERWTMNGLYPYCRFYLEDIRKRNGVYWRNHFNTIGINGMNEALLNLMGKSIADSEGKEFAKEVMDYMREKLLIYQRETGEMFNLEATPAEGTAYRFARIDKSRYPDIVCANEEDVRNKKAEPFYTNSTHLPVDHTDDIFEALNHQDELQTRYNGGTVLHGFMGESLPDTGSVKQLVKKIAANYHLPYFSITPTFSVCPKHGYIKGEWEFCPKCDSEIGYKPISNNQ